MADTFEETAVAQSDIFAPGEIPWHFWAVAAVSLLWNSYGAWDYTSYQLKMAPAIPVIDAAPLWATVCWALGVWGSFVGSILILMRSRHATMAFAISFVAAVISFTWQYFAGALLMPILPAVILPAVVFFWWYSAKMRDAGVLR